VKTSKIATKTMLTHTVSAPYILNIVLILDIFQMPQKIQLTICVGISMACYYVWSGQ